MPSRSSRLIAFIVCLLSSLDAMSAPLMNMGFEKWLGPQLPSKAAVQYDTRGIDRVELQVALGKDLELTTDAYLVTWNGKQLVATDPKKLNIIADKNYLFGRISMRKNGDPVIYTFDVAVNGGPLDGVTVHLRDGLLPVIGKDEFVNICEAVYEIPQDLAIDSGEIDFKVIRVRMK